MTENKLEKRAIRRRMAETGEKYTAASRALREARLELRISSALETSWRSSTAEGRRACPSRCLSWPGTWRAGDISSSRNTAAILIPSLAHSIWWPSAASRRWQRSPPGSRLVMKTDSRRPSRQRRREPSASKGRRRQSALPPHSPSGPILCSSSKTYRPIPRSWSLGRRSTQPLRAGAGQCPRDPEGDRQGRGRGDRLSLHGSRGHRVLWEPLAAVSDYTLAIEDDYMRFDRDGKGRPPRRSGSSILPDSSGLTRRHRHQVSGLAPPRVKSPPTSITGMRLAIL